MSQTLHVITSHAPIALDQVKSPAQGRNLPLKCMPYGLIALVAVVVLGVLYVCLTDASLWSKLLITGLVLLSLFGFHHLPFIKLLLQVGLGLFLILYFKVRYEVF